MSSWCISVVPRYLNCAMFSSVWMFFCILLTRHEFFWLFASRLISLWGTNVSSVFFFMLCIFSPSKLMFSVQFQSLPVNWDVLMPYFKAKLDSIGGITSLCFRPLWTRNVSDRWLSVRTLLSASFKYIILNAVIIFMGVPNSRKILSVQYVPRHWIIDGFQICE